MSIRDISGIFSRFFISGFFLPTFFALFVLWETVTDDFLPADFQRESNATQILVLGGLALLIGLIVMGLRHPIVQLFEGYYFRFRPLEPALIALQRSARQRIAREAPESTLTKWKLDRLFPLEEERLLSTRLGNAIRAAEDHAYIRWGLDHIAVWPRIDPLLNEREQELHSNARSDLHFFMNSAIGAVVVGCVLIADEIANRPLSGLDVAVYLIPFLIAYLLYRMAIGAAERWGLEMRASADLHRFEVYEKIGVRRPSSHSDEREKIAPRVNALLLKGEPLPLDVWDNPAEESIERVRTVSYREAAPGEPRERLPGEGSPGEPRVPVEPAPEPSPGEPREPVEPAPEPSPGEPRPEEWPGTGEASPGEPRD